MCYFNTEIICLKCKEKEKSHPRYEEARKAENEAVKRGDYNFGGIGYGTKSRLPDIKNGKKKAKGAKLM